MATPTKRVISRKKNEIPHVRDVGISRHELRVTSIRAFIFARNERNICVDQIDVRYIRWSRIGMNPPRCGTCRKRGTVFAAVGWPGQRMERKHLRTGTIVHVMPEKMSELPSLKQACLNHWFCAYLAYFSLGTRHAASIERFGSAGCRHGHLSVGQKY